MEHLVGHRTQSTDTAATVLEFYSTATCETNSINFEATRQFFCTHAVTERLDRHTKAENSVAYIRGSTSPIVDSSRHILPILMEGERDVWTVELMEFLGAEG